MCFSTWLDCSPHAYRSAFMLSMQLDCWRADFSPCLSFVSKLTLMRSIFGLLCASNVVSSSITLSCKLKKGETTQSGERNSTISGMKGKVLSTDAEQRKLTWKARMMIRQSYNMLTMCYDWRTEVSVQGHENFIWEWNKQGCLLCLAPCNTFISLQQNNN